MGYIEILKCKLIFIIANYLIEQHIGRLATICVEMYVFLSGYEIYES